MYHIGAAVFTTVALLYYIVLGNSFGWFDGFCVAYFVFDYAAEMYDPHPDTPGPWFKAHFHRFFDGDVEEVVYNDPLDAPSPTLWSLLFS